MPASILTNYQFWTNRDQFFDYNFKHFAIPSKKLKTKLKP